MTLAQTIVFTVGEKQTNGIITREFCEQVAANWNRYRNVPLLVEFDHTKPAGKILDMEFDGEHVKSTILFFPSYTIERLEHWRIVPTWWANFKDPLSGEELGGCLDALNLTAYFEPVVPIEKDRGEDGNP